MWLTNTKNVEVLLNPPAKDWENTHIAVVAEREGVCEENAKVCLEIQNVVWEKSVHCDLMLYVLISADYHSCDISKIHLLRIFVTEKTILLLGLTGGTNIFWDNGVAKIWENRDNEWILSLLTKYMWFAKCPYLERFATARRTMTLETLMKRLGLFFFVLNIHVNSKNGYLMLSETLLFIFSPINPASKCDNKWYLKAVQCPLSSEVTLSLGWMN